MKIVFTICSNNYLSQAKTLGDSLVKYNSEYKFVIGLCDKKNETIDYSFFEPYEIIEVEKLNIINFEWMVYNYHIIELNTAIKPFYFKYLQELYKDIEVIVYMDPDIKIFDSLDIIESELKNSNILLTPHILSPIPLDEEKPNENIFLNYGIYNLGFLGIKLCEEVNQMLEWWSNKLANECFNKVHVGLFVDQLPMNFTPIFFENVGVSKNLGLNFAYWNFHERKLSKKNNKYFVNETFPLVFFHFSSFKPELPLKISRHQTRYNLEEKNLLYEFFYDYYQILLGNKYMELIDIPCYYTGIRNEKLLEIQMKNNTLKRKTHILLKKTYYRLMRF